MPERLASVVLVALALSGCFVPLRADPDIERGPCTPQQVHVGLTGNPTELRVSWKTEGSSCPSGVTSGPATALSTTPMDPSFLTAHHGRQHSYSWEDMCSAPARSFHFGPNYLHTAVLTGLQPGERHFYQIEGGRVVEFTAPVHTGPTHRFRFLVFGDMGESEHREAKSPGASRTVEQLAGEVEDGAELILHIGDISYANGRDEIWDTFMESIEPFARHTPYMVGAGNHEYDYERPRGSSGIASPRTDPSGEEGPYQPDWGNYGNDSGGECGVQISQRFVMPDVADHGYWTRRLGFNNTSTSSRSSSTGGGRVDRSGSGGGSGSSDDGSSSGRSSGEGGNANSSSGGDGGATANPTLGPDAAGKLLQPAAAAQRAARRQALQRQVGRQQPTVQQQQEEDWQERQPGGSIHPIGSVTADASNTSGRSGSNGVSDVGSPRPNPPFWYSFSYGSVHFVVISTEHDLNPGSKQYRWLERDLQLVDRCTTPWVVLGMHRPMYVVYPHKSNRIVGEHLRDQLEGLLNEYQVDLILSGHVHSYSRTCNVLDEQCVPADRGGMTHIIVGCAGRKLTDVAHGQEEWLEYAAVRFGYGRVTVDSGYSLLFELVGDDGVVHDSVKLHNSRARLRGCTYDDAEEARAVEAAMQQAAAAAAGEASMQTTLSRLLSTTSGGLDVVVGATIAAAA